MKIVKIPKDIVTKKVLKINIGDRYECPECGLTIEIEGLELASNVGYKTRRFNDPWLYYKEISDNVDSDCLTEEFKKDLKKLSKRFGNKFDCIAAAFDVKEKTIRMKCPNCGEIFEGDTHYCVDEWFGKIGRVYYDGPAFGLILRKTYHIDETNEEFTFLVAVGFDNPDDNDGPDNLEDNELCISDEDKKWLLKLGFEISDDHNDEFNLCQKIDIE